MNAFLCIAFSQKSLETKTVGLIWHFSFGIKYAEMKTFSLFENRGLFINLRSWREIIHKILRK